MTIYQRIKKFWQRFTPKYRRGLQRRRLETILQAHGVSVKESRRITWHFFNPKKGNKL